MTILIKQTILELRDNLHSMSDGECIVSLKKRLREQREVTILRVDNTGVHQYRTIRLKCQD
jgi:hypothetical protein